MRIIVGGYDGSLHGWEANPDEENDDADALNDEDTGGPAGADTTIGGASAADILADSDDEGAGAGADDDYSDDDDEGGGLVDLELVYQFFAHEGCVRCAATSACGTVLATGGNDAVIRVFDLVKRVEIGSLMAHAGAITCLALEGLLLLQIGAEQRGFIAGGQRDGQRLVLAVRVDVGR